MSVQGLVNRHSPQAWLTEPGGTCTFLCHVAGAWQREGRDRLTEARGRSPRRGQEESRFHQPNTEGPSRGGSGRKTTEKEAEMLN